MNNRCSKALSLALGLILGMPPAALSEEGEDPLPKAKVSVQGYGFWGNRKLMRVFSLLSPKSETPPTFDETTIEDASIMLLTTVHDDGYLRPSMYVWVNEADGASDVFSCDLENLLDLPSGFAADEVLFKVERGILYRYESVQFEGLNSISEEMAREFFVGADFLIDPLSNLVFTPARLNQGIVSLRETLRREGYADAEVFCPDENVEIDHETGRVRVVIEVAEGRHYSVGRSQVSVYVGEGENRELSAVRSHVHNGVSYSRDWQQGFEQETRNREFEKGYADTSVSSRAEKLDDGIVNLSVAVDAGMPFTTGEIIFVGNDRTKEGFLRRKVPVRPGDLLDILKVQDGRYEMAKTGIFETSDVSYETIEGRYVRNVRYELQELPPTDLSILLGYGSYELLRGGIEITFRNMWGIGHSSRLDLIQSFKSSKASYDYSIPNIFDTTFDAFGELSALRREEPSFDREEFRGAVGASDYFETIASDLSIEYAYELLDAQRSEISDEFGADKAVSSNILLRMNHERTDNPLYPGRGYKVSGTLEYASEFLGGDVDYLRAKVAGAWYHTLASKQVFHLGLSHSFVVPFGNPVDNLPFNKRFFPGGENTVRGYKQGEASPRDADGHYVGTQSFILANLEMEQPLTEEWAIVLFVDAIGIADSQADYPANRLLSSVGIGIRYRTVLGPIRLEYGHNVNPREDDPSGALHFSVGVPF